MWRPDDCHATCHKLPHTNSISLYHGSLWIAAEQDVSHVTLYLYSILYDLGRLLVVLLTLSEFCIHFGLAVMHMPALAFICIASTRQFQRWMYEEFGVICLGGWIGPSVHFVARLHCCQFMTGSYGRNSIQTTLGLLCQVNIFLIFNF